MARHQAETKRIEELQKPIEQAKKELEEAYRKQIFDERISRLPEYMQLAWRTPKEQRTQGQQLNAEQIEKTLIIKAPEIVARMSEEERKRHEELVRRDRESRQGQTGALRDGARNRRGRSGSPYRRTFCIAGRRT